MTGKDKALAEAVAKLIDVLDQQYKFDRCNAPGCRRLVVGTAIIGPAGVDLVCEKHVPPRQNLIGGEDDITGALRSVLKKLGKYGIEFDLETGERKK